MAGRATRDHYRVSWSPVTSGAELNEGGIFTDLAANLAGLPSGAMVTIHVTARNSAGETAREANRCLTISGIPL